MRKDLKTNLFDAIYFLDADRIAREVTIQTIIIEEILKHRKRLLSLGRWRSSSARKSSSEQRAGNNLGSRKGSCSAVASTPLATTTSRRPPPRYHVLLNDRVILHGRVPFGKSDDQEELRLKSAPKRRSDARLGDGLFFSITGSAICTRVRPEKRSHEGLVLEDETSLLFVAGIAAHHSRYVCGRSFWAFRDPYRSALA